MIAGNQIHNLTNAAPTITKGANAILQGITIASISNYTVTGNLIDSLISSEVTTPVSAAGIVNATTSSSSYSFLIAKNFVNNLVINSSHTYSSSVGIYSAPLLSGTYANNMLRLGITTSANTAGHRVYGIYDTSGTAAGSAAVSYFFNSVFIGGAPSTGTSQNTYALYSMTDLSASTTRKFQNNIFFNSRSGATPGKHYAASFKTTGVLAAGLQSNYNVLATGTAPAVTFLCQYGTTPADYTSLSAWNTASGQDLGSINADPKFLNPTAGDATVDLHISGLTPTPVERAGIPVAAITDDYDGQARSGLSPVDIGADAGDFILNDQSGPLFIYTALQNSSGTNSRNVTNIGITDASGVNGNGGTRPRMYFKRSTDADIYVDNTSASNGWKYVEANESSSPFSFTADYSLLNGAVTSGSVIQYFFIAQDQAGTVHVSNTSGAFASAPADVALTSAAFPVGTTTNYTVVGALTGELEVGVGKLYTSFTENTAQGLFYAINNGLLSGSVTAKVTSDITESGTVSLSQWIEEGTGNYSLTIQPSAATVRTISAANLASNAPMLNINGADRVVMDGRFSGDGNYLLFRNTNTTPASCGPAIQILNTASACTLKYITVETNTTSSTNADIVLGSSGANDITIDNCELRDASGGTTGQPYAAVYSANRLNSMTLTNNKIYNFSDRGVLLTSIANNAVITGNHFYYSLAPIMNKTVHCLNIGGGLSSGHTISDNYFGGSAPNCGGTAWQDSGSVAFYAMNLTLSTSSLTSIQNNTVQNISLLSGYTSASCTTMYFSGGQVNIGGTTGNTIGHSSNANSITSSGSGNVIGMLCAGGTTGSYIVRNNLVANLSSTCAFSSSPSVRGIDVTGSSGLGSTIKNNVVRDISSTSNNAAQFNPAVQGIYAGASGNTNIVEDNSVYNLTANPTNNEVNSCVQGIYFAGSGGIIRGNRLYNLVNNSITNGALINGYYIATSVLPGWQVNNNFASLGIGSEKPTKINAFYDNSNNAGGSEYYYNTIYIGGAVATGDDASTVCFSRNSSGSNGGSTNSLKNNIFYINRSGGIGAHIIYANNASMFSNWIPGSQDYNFVRVPDTNYYARNLSSSAGGSILSLSAWKDSSGNDAHSKINEALVLADTSAGNLHLAGTSNGDRNLTGTPLAAVAIDIDGDPRHTLYPYIGADEASIPLVSSLTLTAFIEGFFSPGTNTQVPDTISAVVKNAVTFATVDSARAALNSAGQASFQFRNALNGISYYLVLQHRNSIETWSAVPASFLSSALSYNFTTAASQAYGSNLVQKGSAFCMYGGDVNQDGIVDFTDLVAIDNDQYNFVSGYVITDITGDDFVDFSDLTICDNNQYNFVSVIAPISKQRTRNIEFRKQIKDQ